MAMTNELPGLRVGCSKSKPEHDIIETPFELRKKIFASYTLLADGTLEVQMELALENAIHPFDLLFLPKLQAVSDNLCSPVPSMFSRDIVAFVDATRRLETPFALEEQLHSLPAA